MKYSVDKEQQYCVLRLDEDKLDASLAPDLKSEFLTIHAEGYKNMIIDMGQVKYTDSSGLSALLVGNRIFHDEGGIFVLANLNEHVKKLVKISQLNNVLNILPTIQEGVDAVFMNEIENDLNSGTSPNGENGNK